MTLCIFPLFSLVVHWLLKQLITGSGALAAIRAQTRWGNKYGGLERSTTMPVSGSELVLFLGSGVSGGAAKLI